jgi:hypothetical protein
MATIDWPAGLIPQAAELSLRKAGAQFASPFNGTLQAVDFIAERWVLSCSLAPQFQHDPRGVGPFANTLAGGVERVRVWPFHTGGAPRGSLRGTPTLSATVNRGATTLQLAGARNAINLLNRSSFELDSNVDGLADGWATYTNGTTGTVTPSAVVGLNSPAAQRLDATGLGTAASDQVGLRYLADADVVAGTSYSLSADTRDSGVSVRLSIDWFNVSATYLGTTGAVGASSGGVWTRRAVSGVAPAGAVVAKVYVWMEARPTSAGAAALEVDNVQFERAAAATHYSGPATLLAGDFIGAGGQLFQAAANATAADDASMAVPIVNRVRGTIASGSAVTWYRPTCEMVLPAMQAGPVRRPGLIESTALDFVEVW